MKPGIRDDSFRNPAMNVYQYLFAYWPRAYQKSDFLYTERQAIRATTF